MSTQQVTVPKGQWVAVTSVSTQGTIDLRKGSVVLTEQSSLPVDPPSEVPWSSSLSSNGEGGTYANVNSGESVYAYGVDDSLLDVTPVGGVL